MLAINVIGDLLYALYLAGIIFCALCAANLPNILSSHNKGKKIKNKLSMRQGKKRSKY
jgi:hypothetical protein